MEAFFKAEALSKSETVKELKKLGLSGDLGQESFLPREYDADLAWHVRAWGHWVLDQARRELARFYPVYADFEPLVEGKAYERQLMRLLPLKEDGTPDIDSLNAEFGDDYLKVKENPRWVAKPTVAYLWSRTVTCKNCRATIPLLKTRWLSKKDRKREVLTIEPNVDKTGVVFNIQAHVPVKGGNAAQRREHDKRLGAGTMTRAGAQCPCCPAIMTIEDIQVEGQSNDWGTVQLCTVVDSPESKEFRCATAVEEAAFAIATASEDWTEVPFGRLEEPIDPARPSPNARGMSGLTRYGINCFGKVYNSRQRVSLAAFTRLTQRLERELNTGYAKDWVEAIQSELALAIDRVADSNSTLCHWDCGYQKIAGTFQRYALRVNWDFCEVNPFAETTGNYLSAVEWIANVIEHTLRSSADCPAPSVRLSSATQINGEPKTPYDLILTDPPYYDAIPYADVSDFFYVWLRRAIGNRFPREFETQLVPKTEELIQHAGRFGGDNQKAKQFYEDGMARAFASMKDRLADQGRFVVVFAHKHPDAWETLASSMIRAGFTVDASWPIETEMPNKAAGGARLASSVWLVCKKRPETARSGWDNKVLEEMRANIGQRLRDFWDAGIRGPDFVWAATGPALEAYSRHPVVKMANDPGQTLTVSEFLNHARRMVVDFVVGRVLEKSGEPIVEAAVDRLDEATAYYLLHRNDFGLDEAPVGACILYATACSLSDQELSRDWDLLVKTGGDETNEADGDDVERNSFRSDEENGMNSVLQESSGSKVKLKPWNQRRGRSMGYEAPGGRPVPLIDRIHRLMHLWKAGDVHKVDEYLDEHGLRRHELFRRVLQSLIELSKPGSEERSLLESLSNHIGAKGARKKDLHREFPELAAEPSEVE